MIADATYVTAADHLRPFSFRSIAVTHPGCVRTLNEDACLDRPDIGLWAVADGMGGHAAGDFASRSVVQSLGRVSKFRSPFQFSEDVRSALMTANSMLWQKAEADLSDTIGSTVVSLLVHRGHYACIWAGDSRAYLWREGDLRRITRDHTLVQDLLDSGALSAAEARHHGSSHIVTRAVGASRVLELDSVYGPVAQGDRFLLCSDGLEVLPEAEIANALQIPSLGEAAALLLSKSLKAGAPDNVSVIVVECGGTS